MINKLHQNLNHDTFYLTYTLAYSFHILLIKIYLLKEPNQIRHK